MFQKAYQKLENVEKRASFSPMKVTYEHSLEDFTLHGTMHTLASAAHQATA